MGTLESKKSSLWAGIMFLISAIAYAIFRTMREIQNMDIIDPEYRMAGWNYIVATLVGGIFLASYCFGVEKTKLNKVFYLVGVSAYLGIGIYSFSFDILSEYFDVYSLLDFLYICMATVLLICKFVHNKVFAIITVIVMGTYLCLLITLEVSSITRYYFDFDFPWFLCIVYMVTETIAFFSFWWFECKNVFKKKKMNDVVIDKSSIENDLVSLKRLYDSGIITEEEYIAKKSYVLSHL